MTLSLPAPALELGTPPRLCYPLVIFLLRIDSEERIHPDQTVSALIYLAIICLIINFYRRFL